MGYLSAVTLLWAFSFSLIGVYLAGQVDSWFSVLMRVALASLVFLPFLRFKGVDKGLIARLMVIGGFQLGLMYCFYYQSFLLLSVPEVLLFTVFTPIYVTIIYDLLKRRFSPWYLVTAAIAVAEFPAVLEVRKGQSWAPARLNFRLRPIRRLVLIRRFRGMCQPMKTSRARGWPG